MYVGVWCRLQCSLWDAWGTICSSSNNVRDVFTPYGNADTLETGLYFAKIRPRR